MNTPIESWKLTAYLLGELESDETEHIRAAIESDPSLQSQLQELQSVIGRVQSALQHADAEPCLTEIQTTAIADQIQLAKPSNVESQKLDVSLSETELETQRRSASRFSRSQFVGLAAMAASLLVAVYLIPRAFENTSHNQKTAHVQLDADTVANNQNVLESKFIDPNLPAVRPVVEALDLDIDGRLLERPAPKYAGSTTTSAGTLVFSGTAGHLGYSGTTSTSTDRLFSMNMGQSEGVQYAENGVAKSEPTALAAGSIAGPFWASNPSHVASTQEKDQPASTADGSNPIANSSESVELQIKESNALYDKRTSDLYSLSNPSGEVSEVAGRKLSDNTLVVGGVATTNTSNLPGDGHFYLNGNSFAKSNAGTLSPNDTLMLSVTPRIIIPEEEGKVTSRSIEDRTASQYGLKAPPALHSSPSGDRYEPIIETPFASTEQTPLSTFSIDVDTASYSKVRQYLMQANQLPQPNAVRIEEMLNYFEYDYKAPKDEHPFASSMAITTCPWNEEHKLVRIGLQAKKIDVKQRAKANIVFLLDVSGSMDEPNKLPLVKQAISMLVRQLGENDRVAMVVYAGAAGCVLPSINGDRQAQILAALDDLNAGGSTNGGQGIELAYSIAREHFVPGGINRVILCTDGDFNVGTTSNEALIQLVQEQAKSKVFLTCLGFGMGNYNDSMMEQITNQGNGVYGMVDSALEARRMMVEQLAGTLVTVAKDVKIQIEFNPTKIASYRLIGYENRRLAKEDFNNDQKDAGEIGAGHRVTALYEIIPLGKEQLRYSSRLSPRGELEDPANQPNPNPNNPNNPTNPAREKEWLSLALRYKQPEADVSSKIEFFLTDEAVASSICDADFQWAGAVAEFGLLLRRSQLAPQASWDRMLQRARSSTGENAYRMECLEMMTKAKSLAGK